MSIMPMKLTVAFGARSLSARRYTDREQKTRDPFHEGQITTRDRFRPRRLVVALAAAVLICWALLYIGEYLGVQWVREAGGSVVRAAF
jgi:hypothetical protein